MKPVMNTPVAENQSNTQHLLLQEANPVQSQQIRELLMANQLPVEDLDEGVKLLALTQKEELLGSAGLEMYEKYALLRSVSVAEAAKGQGLGRWMSHEVEKLARQAGVEALYLVTTTAEAFFARLGYQRISREQVAAGVLRSGQFNGICPASAAVMMKWLK